MIVKRSNSGSVSALLSGSLCVSLLAGPSMVSAQAGSSASAIEEIVVTARKREETLQDLPVTATVFSEDAIDRFNLNNMEDLSEFTPGLIISNDVVQGLNVALRGVSTAPGNMAASQSVSFVFDNVPVSSATPGRFGQVDMRQMEVLKGPQSLFFGKNTTAGLLNYVSNDPSDEFEFKARAGYENEAEQAYGQIILSGPLTDTLKGRLVARYTEMDGWLDREAPANTTYDSPGVFDLANGVLIRPFEGYAPGSTNDTGPYREEAFFRGTLLWDPLDSVSMQAKLSYSDLEDDGAIGTAQLNICDAGMAGPVFNQMNLLAQPPAITGVHLPGDDCDFDDTAPHHSPSREATDVLLGANARAENWGDSDILLGSVELNWGITDVLSLTSVTGLFRYDFETFNQFLPGIGSGLHAAHVPTENESLTQELRIASNYDGAFNFMTGVFFEDAKFENQTRVWFPPFGLVTALNPVRRIETDGWSAFAQFDWDITDTVTLSGGGRYTEEDKEHTPIVNGVKAPQQPFNDQTYDNFSPEVTVTWRPQDHLSFFASYKEGFKSGGFNATFVVFASDLIRSPLDLSFVEEEADGFEIGAKTQWLDNRLQFNASVYYYDFTDLQTVQFDPSVGGLQVINAGEMNTHGVEMDLVYLPEAVEGLLFSASLAWNDSEFTEDFDFDCYSGQIPATGCIDGKQSLKGQRPTQSPEYQATFFASYEVALTDSMILDLFASAAYSDEFFHQQEHDPRAIQDSYWKYDAGASLNVNDHWTLSITGRNLSDEVTCGNSGNSTNSLAFPSDMFCNSQRARQVWAEAEYRF